MKKKDNYLKQIVITIFVIAMFFLSFPLIGIVGNITITYTSATQYDVEYIIVRVSVFIVWIFITVSNSIKISNYFDKLQSRK